jgi:uncharacterized membrane protein HdeD (DUF308 family)
MNLRERLNSFEHLGKNWSHALIRGGLMLAAGVLIVIASLFNPDGSILHGSEFSWLPVSGIVIILVGLTELLDAYFAKDLGRYLLHVQGGVFDLVAGGFIAFSISGRPENLSLLLAAYLIVKAILRILVVRAIDLPQGRSVSLGAWVSIVLGLTIWAKLPGSEAWFLSLCLGTDILLRGWSQTLFALWLREQSAKS